MPNNDSYEPNPDLYLFKVIVIIPLVSFIGGTIASKIILHKENKFFKTHDINDFGKFIPIKK